MVVDGRNGISRRLVLRGGGLFGKIGVGIRSAHLRMKIGFCAPALVSVVALAACGGSSGADSSGSAGTMTAAGGSTTVAGGTGGTSSGVAGAPGGGSMSYPAAGGASAGTGGSSTGGGASGASGGAGGTSGGESGASNGGTSAASCPMLVVGGAKPSSSWVYVDKPGHLAYKALPTGEHILDFSTAGYMGGGVALPSPPVVATVKPSGTSDDTMAIQTAIDAVSKMLQPGQRGAVLLAPGTFQLLGSLTISHSGVVLRGSGSGAGAGTELYFGGSPRTALTIAGAGSWQTTGTAADITDAYVPSGATSVHVSSTAGLTPGTSVLVKRTFTAAWIAFEGMAPAGWLSNGSVDSFDRVVTAVSGDTVTFDAALPDTFDVATWGAGAPKATVQPYTFPGRIEQVGIESLSLVTAKNNLMGCCSGFNGIVMTAVTNAWVSDVDMQEFAQGIIVNPTAKWVTIDGANVGFTGSILNGHTNGYPAQYSLWGQQVLIMKSAASGADFFSFVTQATTNGPNVVLDLAATGAGNKLAPHQRWATGLLVDHVSMPAGNLAMQSRGASNQGWSMAFGVVWNTVASSFLIQSPPGTANWSIGATGGSQIVSGEPGTNGPDLPQGIIDSQGTPVAPSSLYLAQLCERLGPQALTAIGY
jgi:hypothetical protein